MDTSKTYYESVMRDFQTYGRGRSLEEYCRDEGADYRWIEKAKELYGVPTKGKSVKSGKRTVTKAPDMIQLHFEAEPGETPVVDIDSSASSKQESVADDSSPAIGWRVLSLRLKTPAGYEIEVRTSNVSAVSELLTKLTA